MKNTSTHLQLDVIVFLFILLGSQCTTNKNNTYDRIRNAADKIKVINTHEHQCSVHSGEDQHFNVYDLFGYLGGDITSAGGTGLYMDIDSLNLDEIWDKYGKYINFSRNTSFYSSLVKGFQKLYGFNELYFTKDNISALSEQVVKNYSDYPSWFDEAFHKAGFELMLVILADWDDFDFDNPERYFAHVFVINRFIQLINVTSDDGIYPLKSLTYEMLGLNNFRVNDLDDYLVLCDHMLKRNIDAHTVGVKNTLAYNRTSEYEDVPYATAYRLFNIFPEQRTPEEKKKLEDYIFHWTIRKCIEYDLPLQIHTGIGYSDGGNPVKLSNLFRQYPEAKFILLHGGFPWTNECAMLGRQFPNVYIDLSWLPQLSRKEAINGFDVMLDGISYNRFMWGGDCLYIEESTGALETAKDVVAEVLTERIIQGRMTEKVAQDILRKIFRENAIKTYKLEERLGRDFLKMD